MSTTFAMRMGSEDGRRTMGLAPSKSRRRCHCGCRKRATHLGLGDGICLIMGCELYIRRWVRDGGRMRRRRPLERR